MKRIKEEKIKKDKDLNLLDNKIAKESNKKAEESNKENDPIRFGDWQVNGRTIDF